MTTTNQPATNPQADTAPDLYATALHDLLEGFQDNASAKLLLVIDPLLRPLTPDDPLGQLLADIEPTPIELPDELLEPEKCAQLYPLDLSAQAHLNAFQYSLSEALHELDPAQLLQGQGRRIGGWIQSSASVEAVAQHLGLHEVQHSPSQGRVWLRLHDPAVLWSLLQMLYAPQVARLLGVIDTYWFLGPRGHTACASRDPNTPIGAHKMVPSAEEWADIHHIEAINQVLQQLPAQLSADQLSRKWEISAAALHVATQYGIHDMPDRVLFARHALQHGPDFHLRPETQSTITARQPHQSYRELWRHA